MTCKLRIEDGPGYVHALITGERSAAGALKCLKGAYAACVKRNLPDLLLEMRWTGPQLAGLDIHKVIAERSADGAKLRKIAYVETTPSNDPHGPRLAETVAVNRGVNVRLFQDVETAKRWLSES